MVVAEQPSRVDALYSRAAADFERYEAVKDLVDECIDLMLNYRQSGHPGGSRSKVHMLLSLMFSGAMRWDLLRPWQPFGDRFVLSAGHTVPLVYATLAVLNEAFRVRYERDGDERFNFPDNGQWALTWELLLKLRRRGGLPGHAEMEGKTLFLKFNTGPSGHGMPPAVGEALALKHAGADEVKVFVFEGEGGLTPGGAHEARHTAWGLGLSNLVFMVDWNDFGIDERPLSAVVYGTPEDWFSSYGWRVTGTTQGSEWPDVTRAVLEAARGDNELNVPSIAWFKTRKGRGYGKYDYKSHGTPHTVNAPEFWTVRKQFMEKYGLTYDGVDEAVPEDPGDREKQARTNFETALSVFRTNPELTDWVTDRLLEVAASVPDQADAFNLTDRGAVFRDKRVFDAHAYPPEMWKKPGEKHPNRAAYGAWGAYVNAFAKREYGRPLFIGASADLAESTNLAGFGKDFADMPGWGWYERDSNRQGTVLPTQITEFGNAGLVVGLATVNLSADPFNAFNGFWGTCSTYGSFSYLKYGPMRLFSQLAQDCELKVGKVLWVAGHAGPETAEDSRTHFGIFETAVTQLFPEGHVIDLHPWEYNEVPVVLAAAMATDVPITALHVTRPAIEIPDREALGIPSHFEAARGAYVMREFKAGLPRGGTVFVQGTTSTANVVKMLPQLDDRGLNVKIVACISPQLFAMQDEAYRESVASLGDRWDGMAITNRAWQTMRHWIGGPVARDYSLTSDWDDRWRTGGTVDEVIDEAHLGPGHVIDGIQRFVDERPIRMRRLREIAEAADKH
ncbi:MAG: transketolase [Candidatus Limnocylindrales bacterium]